MRDNGAIQGGNLGFKEGDSVIVQKVVSGSTPVYRVLGQVTGKRICFDPTTGYYIFYQQGGLLNVGLVKYENGVLTLMDSKSATNIGMDTTSDLVFIHTKKFQHIVAGTLRDLYFVATSLYINPNPIYGWYAFCYWNSWFPLVSNNSNSKLPMTAQLMADMTSVNTDVNTNHNYYPDPAGNDYWHIMSPGETGDCEDFALTKAQALLNLGYPASAIHIECGRIDGYPAGHAWLVVQTEAGDYALDLGDDNPLPNASMRPPTLPEPYITPSEYTARRRQIGRKWAFLSPYGWMSGSTNQTPPGTIWYILDPLLNMFHIIPPTQLRYLPFLSITSNDGVDLATSSINFSEDNTQIHVADPSGASGTIRTLRLDENVLTQVGTRSYTGRGFVGRNGFIQEPDGTFGRQDPFAYGGELYNVYLKTFSGVNYLSSINEDREGTFKALRSAKVTSKSGYYEHDYSYLTGEFYDDEGG